MLGWLLLRGRCRTCRTAISPRYPAVEALTAALAVAVILVEHSTVDKVLGLVLVGILVPIALIDLDHQIIPNKITAPAAILAVAIGLALKPSGVPEQLIAGAGAAAFLLVFVFAYPRGMGMGDVKLAGVLGLFLGREVGVAIFVAVDRRHARGRGCDGASGRPARTQDKGSVRPVPGLGRHRRAARRPGDRSLVPPPAGDRIAD